MKNKKIILVVTISALVSLFSMFGVTYALLFKSHTFNNTINYETSSLELSMDYENKFTLNNLPMAFEQTKDLDLYKVTINNKGSIPYKYNLKLLSTITDNIIDLSYIKIQLIIDNNDILCKTKDSICNENTLDKDKIYPSLKELNNTLISNQILNVNESKDIYFKLWLDINTPNTQIGKNFNAKLVLDAFSYYDINNTNNNVVNNNIYNNEISVNIIE